MPNLTLRHSKNLPPIDFNTFFTTAHELLVKTLGVKINACSSAVIAHEHYLVGIGEQIKAFVHLEIAVKPGKSPESLDLASKSILELLEHYFIQPNMQLKVSTNISEVGPFYRSQ